MGKTQLKKSHFNPYFMMNINFDKLSSEVKKTLSEKDSKNKISNKSVKAR